MNVKMLIEIVVAAVTIAAIVAMVWFASSYGCAARWSQSGMVTSFGFTQGCLVGHEGKLVPERNYRETL